MKNIIQLHDIEAVLAEYKTVSQKLKALETQKENLRNTIMLEINQSGTDKLIAGEMVATVTSVARENFNLKIAKEQLGVELLSPFISTSNSKRLTVK
jgi:cell shape-determining protein MreC